MKIEHLEAFNFEGAIRGMRNPKNSWSKSDSYWENTFDESKHMNVPKYVLGENDLNLAVRLTKAGNEHRKFNRQLFICFDLTAPLYLWKEFDQYKIATTTNSTSTMHTIQNKEITLDLFETGDMEQFEIKEFETVLGKCELYRKLFLECSRVIKENKFECEEEKKNVQKMAKSYWKALIRLLPESWLQKRTVTMTYETARSIYHQRANHKLVEWEFIRKELEKLPYAKEFIID